MGQVCATALPFCKGQTHTNTLSERLLPLKGINKQSNPNASKCTW
jgi:hypothetical protein